MTKPTIVINAYNRPMCLQRLLLSFENAEIDEGTTIVFSLEYGAHDDVVKLANLFDWKYGKKEIIQQEKKQGLIGHFLFCGGLTAKYGAIIYLEDDLLVGRAFYKYAKAVLNNYGSEDSVAGFSLNALWFNGYLHLPFHPIDDSNPSFFLQVPWWGLIFTDKQWKSFKDWYDIHKDDSEYPLIHPLFKKLDTKDEWYPAMCQYLIENDKYYCFPRSSHCINFGDAGTHFEKKSNFFQTELALDCNDTGFKQFKDCLAVYDSLYELLPDKLKQIAPALKDYDFELDLNGTRDLATVKSEYIITSVKPDSFIKKYGLEMRPQELNIVYSVDGDQFYLTQTKNAQNIPTSKELFYKQFFYHHRFRLSKKERFRIWLKGY